VSRLVVGVPREVKADEHRVAITPEGVREVTGRGASVLVEAGAGRDSAIGDEEYAAAGAQVVRSVDELWERASLVCKVKEPQSGEFERLRPGLVLFTYLHLAAYPAVAEALLDRGVTGIAYETVQDERGGLPLLAPMSEVAGRLSVQIGAHYLEKHNGGRGVLLGGAPGVQPARIVVMGAGNVGWNAAWIAAGNEAEVRLLDRDLDRLRFVDQIHKGRITTLASNRGEIERVVEEADLVIAPRRSSPRSWCGPCVRGRSSSTWRSTRGAASRPYARPPTPTPSTSTTTSSTTASATYPAPYRARRPTP
jgi:alanine dehydrogenase